MVETQTTQTIKRLQPNNGLEHCNQLFDAYRNEHKIVRYTTMMMTPQKNCLAEIMNKIILEKVKRMLKHSKQSIQFQAKALNTIVYLINWSPSAATSFKNSIEMWSRQAQNLGNIEIFGCTCLLRKEDYNLDYWNVSSWGIKMKMKLLDFRIVLPKGALFVEMCFSMNVNYLV